MYSNTILLICASILIFILLLFTIGITVLILELLYNMMYSLTNNKFWSIFAISIITIIDLVIFIIVTSF